MSLQGKRGLLLVRLQEVEELLKSNTAQGTHFDASVAGLDVKVVIGTTKLLGEHPELTDRLSKMINDAYAAVGGHALMLQQQPVLQRLRLGDGADARGDGIMNRNRVLHVAFVGSEAVGCISSSKSTTWKADMGHWGLLVVDLKMQGKGIASALIAAAEARVMESCASLQIEYEFRHDSEHSKKLEAVYAKRGYKIVMKVPQGGVTPGEFRIAHKEFSLEDQLRGQSRRLLAERAEITALLPTVEEACPARTMQATRFFHALSAFVTERGADNFQNGVGSVKQVYQFIVVDVTPQFAFVLDLKNGSGSVEEGVVANPDITISMTDDNLIAWWKNSLEWQDAFWSGSVVMTSSIEARGGPGCWWSDSVSKLTELLTEVPEVSSTSVVS